MMRIGELCATRASGFLTTCHGWLHRLAGLATVGCCAQAAWPLPSRGPIGRVRSASRCRERAVRDTDITRREEHAAPFELVLPRLRALGRRRNFAVAASTEKHWTNIHRSGPFRAACRISGQGPSRPVLGRLRAFGSNWVHSFGCLLPMPRLDVASNSAEKTGQTWPIAGQHELSSVRRARPNFGRSPAMCGNLPIARPANTCRRFGEDSTSAGQFHRFRMSFASIRQVSPEIRRKLTRWASGVGGRLSPR